MLGLIVKLLPLLFKCFVILLVFDWFNFLFGLIVIWCIYCFVLTLFVVLMFAFAGLFSLCFCVLLSCLACWGLFVCFHFCGFVFVCPLADWFDVGLVCFGFVDIGVCGFVSVLSLDWWWFSCFGFFCLVILFCAWLLVCGILFGGLFGCFWFWVCLFCSFDLFVLVGLILICCFLVCCSIIGFGCLVWFCYWYCCLLFALVAWVWFVVWYLVPICFVVVIL